MNKTLLQKIEDVMAGDPDLKEVVVTEIKADEALKCLETAYDDMGTVYKIMGDLRRKYLKALEALEHAFLIDEVVLDNHDNFLYTENQLYFRADCNAEEWDVIGETLSREEAQTYANEFWVSYITKWLTAVNRSK